MNALKSCLLPMSSSSTRLNQLQDIQSGKSHIYSLRPQSSSQSRTYKNKTTWDTPHDSPSRRQTSKFRPSTTVVKIKRNRITGAMNLDTSPMLTPSPSKAQNTISMIQIYDSQTLAKDRPDYSETPSGLTKTQNLYQQDPNTSQNNLRQTLYRKKTMHRPTSNMNLLGDFVGPDSKFKNAAANG